ncbi:MAG TPA: glycosyltransferase [Acidimicrobiales bacterium]|nr:glycosyltransferase [Acidimicrobiales bacterium]
MTDVSIPPVAPVAPGEGRPQWSVMIPTYNCADFLRTALEGVLAQDPGPDAMQIEVVDDCSTADRPEAVAAAVGGDRVRFYRHPANVGIANNFTACLQRSRGRWLHLLHGDDSVYPGLYRRVGSLLSSRADIDAVVVGADDIDEAGIVIRKNVPLRPRQQTLDDFEQGIFSWNPLRAPAVMARRSVYESMGGFRPELRYCADWDMWKRMTSRFRLLYDPEVLVGYRIHGRSDTAKMDHSVEQLREMIDSVVIGHGYLPDGRSRAWTREFYSTTRDWALHMLRTGDQRPAIKDASGYATIVVESVLRQQADRILARTAQWHRT